MRKVADCPFVLHALEFHRDANIILSQNNALLPLRTRRVECMLTELCNSDLFDLIAERGPILDRKLLRAMFKQICIAVDATK